MSPEIFTEEQRDALQEIANIGMGQAGSSIARIFDEFIQLSIPLILLVRPHEIGGAIQRIVREERVCAVRQAFHGELRGEALLIYGEGRCRELAELMGHDGALDDVTQNELLMDVTNVLVGASLGGIAEQLKVDVGFSAPSMAAERVAANEVITAQEMKSSCALFIEVNFRVESHSFACHLITLLPEKDIHAVCKAVDRFIENLSC